LTLNRLAKGGEKGKQNHKIINGNLGKSSTNISSMTYEKRRGRKISALRAAGRGKLSFALVDTIGWMGRTPGQCSIR